MARDLPWFKYDVSKYINGAITLEEYYVQGVFSNICAHYWFKSGKLTLTEIKRRLSDAKPEAFQSLIDSNILKLEGDDIRISFLDEQLQERGHQSKVNSLNGSKGGRPKSKKKPTAFISLNESKAKKSNIEERREEERREEYYTSGENAFEEIKADELLVESLHRLVTQQGYRSVTKLHIIVAVRSFITKESAKDGFTDRPKRDIREHLLNWINKNPKNIYEQSCGVS